MKPPFNLSDWALNHRSMIWYFMLVAVAAGVFAYLSLGREEDPAFTIKTMVIEAQWPGADADEVSRQVTERITARARVRTQPVPPRRRTGRGWGLRPADGLGRVADELSRRPARNGR